mmetsp:Transcript_34867/g.98876  ORF Transcript_34867/g.98876 Transcript_34867/m.98876 type:complete len:266 (+) Transcript_34867:167-964(+)
MLAEVGLQQQQASIPYQPSGVLHSGRHLEPLELAECLVARLQDAAVGRHRALGEPPAGGPKLSQLDSSHGQVAPHSRQQVLGGVGSHGALLCNSGDASFCRHPCNFRHNVEVDIPGRGLGVRIHSLPCIQQLCLSLCRWESRLGGNALQQCPPSVVRVAGSIRLPLAAHLADVHFDGLQLQLEGVELLRLGNGLVQGLDAVVRLADFRVAQPHGAEAAGLPLLLPFHACHQSLHKGLLARQQVVPHAITLQRPGNLPVVDAAIVH